MQAPPQHDPMPMNISSIQPGGGRLMDAELQWGRFRRFVLRSFFRRYVSEMKDRMNGESPGPSLDVVDNRDLKYFVNIAPCSINPGDDVFAWRRKLPIVHYGFAEVLLIALPLLIAGHFLFWYLPGWWWVVSLPFLVCGLFVVYFFRNPGRLPPKETAALASPADGTVMDIEDIKHRAFGNLPATRIGIFLSVFDVHVNRSPSAGKVLNIKYQEGEFLDARNRDAGSRNENLETIFALPVAPFQRFAVRQIAGSIARKIVNELRTGQEVERCQQIGMIKFGSRVEVVFAKGQVEVDVRVGDRVKAGQSVLGRWVDIPTDTPQPEMETRPKARQTYPPPIEDEERAPPPIPLAD